MSGDGNAFHEQDKRTNPRASCEIPVGWHVQDQVFRDRIRNISTGGVYIETRQAPELGTEVTISVPIGNMQTRVDFHGRVIRINHRGIAVGFDDLTPTQERMIRSFLDSLEENADD